MKTIILFNFDNPDQIHTWQPVDDVVMGGRSQSRMVAGEPGVALYSGYVSLENNGGFASVRSASGRYNLNDYDGVKLRVRGDGKRYGFNVRTGGRFRYEARFDTAPDKWQVVTIPFRAMKAKVFGATVPAPPLNPRAVRAFGFIIADKQAGPFRLEISWIRAYLAGDLN